MFLLAVPLVWIVSKRAFPRDRGKTCRLLKTPNASKRLEFWDEAAVSAAKNKWLRKYSRASFSEGCWLLDRAAVQVVLNAATLTPPNWNLASREIEREIGAQCRGDSHSLKFCRDPALAEAAERWRAIAEAPG